jgi:hypothetical protein
MQFRPIGIRTEGEPLECPALPATPHAADIRLSRCWYAIPLLIFAILLPLYYFAWAAPGVGLYHDDGIYLVTAKALATGRGYTIISLPNEIPQTKYPILFPLLLSFIWRVFPVFPDNICILKLIPLLATAAWLLAVYRLARELSISRLPALCLTACVAANPSVVAYSVSLLSESLFAALGTWAVVFLWRAERTGSLRPALYAALIASAAYHTRTAAVAIMAGGLLGLLLARRFQLATAFGGTCSVLCLPWVLWQGQQKLVPAIESYYTSLNYRQFNIASYFSGDEKLTILWRNLLDTLLAPCQQFVVPITWFGLAVCILFWTVCAFGIARTHSRCVRCATVLSFVMPALWTWPQVRFLVPAAGLVVVAVYPALRHRAVQAGALLLFLLTAVPALQSLQAESRSNELALTGLRDYPATWPQVMDVHRWIHAHASPGDTVVSAMDPLVYLYTGAKSIRSFCVDPLPAIYGLPAKVDNEREFLRVVHQYRPKYLIQMQPGFWDTATVARVATRLLRAGNLIEVHAAGPFHVYAVNQDNLP